MTVKAPVGLHVRWPVASPGPFPGSVEDEEKARKEMNEKIQKIHEAFAQARTYFHAKNAESQQGVPYHNIDRRWEAMAPVFRGEVPVFVHADDIQQIQAAMDWASHEGVRMVLVGGYDAWRVADLLKKEDVSVIIAGVHRNPRRRWEPYDTPFTNAHKLYEAGVRFCIAGPGGGFQTAHARSLPYHAATAAAYGLPRDAALKSVTLYPAEILGVADRLGSIEVGKDATVIVTDGDPLEITTQIEMEFIAGREVDLNNRHRQLYLKYREKYRQLGVRD